MPRAVKRVVADSRHQIAILHEIYDLYRDAALNSKYYGRILARFQRRNKWLEIGIAIGAGGSSIAGFAFWDQTPWGKWAWLAITTGSSFLAFLKPFFNFNIRAERYSRVFTSYLDVYLSLKAMVSRIKRDCDLRQLTEFIQEFDAIERRFYKASRDDDSKIDRKLQKKIEKEVRKEIPYESLWFPNAPLQESESNLSGPSEPAYDKSG